MLFKLLLTFAVTSAAFPQGQIQERDVFVKQTTCNGKQYTYESLAGYGIIPSDARDKLGDTLGGVGSSLALDRGAWKKNSDGSYSGVLWGLPDRGWNTQGTLNYVPRVQKFSVSFKPAPNASISSPSAANVKLTYEDTILFSDPSGTPMTGLDGDALGSLKFPGFPDLPIATYTGDGFGGAGPGGRAVPLDPEGLVLGPEGSFYVSDEYGPYIYKFSSSGKMVQAIRPPEAVIPRRNGSESFSANSPPQYDSKRIVTPGQPKTGRANNQGLEGLTVTGDGRNLYALMQSALNQEGGPEKTTNRYARLLKYDISGTSPRYAREFIVPLPQYVDPTAKPENNPKTAAQSELFHIQNGQFFILARDSGAGHGQASSTSVYRHADIFDITGATDIKSAANDAATGSVVSSTGVLNAAVKPATYCSFIDYNDNTQLGRFGVRNGGAQDEKLLNEKWESLGIVPVDGKIGDDDEWFLFSISDNDFVTQNGYTKFGEITYQDKSGFNLDSQILVFKIKLPEHSRPFNRDTGED
ncbi:MAG: hypothetical protein M1814_003249 [Vezdaea aestivalis]|nr:MAG: hypothetical protein M1814_003249 [Vezdaea aestivalis]